MEYKKIVRQILANQKTSLPRQIGYIKQRVSSGQYRDALKMHPLYLKYIHQTPFFKSVNKVYVKNPFVFTDDFRKEFKWITNLFTPYLSLINDFIGQKNKFEQELIFCKYEEANKTLTLIEENFGITLWSIEANFIIKEHLDGSKGNWNELSFYLKEINNSVYEFIINSSSKRVESNLSYDSYLSQLQNDLDNIQSDNVLKDFFVFKSCNIANYPYQSDYLESILYVSNAFSIFDQYLILMDVVVYNISNTLNNDKTILQFVNSVKSIIINDHRIGNVFNILSTKADTPLLNVNQAFIECCNFYYQGIFEESLKLSLKGISNHPLEFEYYIIYCRSLHNLNTEFQSTNLSDRIDNLLEDVYNFLSFKKDSKSSYSKLLKASLFFMNSSFGKQIYGLISESHGVIKSDYKIGLISSEFTLYKLNYFSKERPHLLNTFKNINEEHSFKVYLYKFGHNGISFNKGISQSKIQTVFSDVVRLFNLEKYSEVIEILIMTTELNDSTYYYEQKLSILFFSYIKINMIREALILFGEIYFNKILIVRKIDIDWLYETINSKFGSF